MKVLQHFVALNILILQAACVNAQIATNGVRLVPGSNIAAARSKYPLGNFGRIATNTPAFEEYALNFMLRRANEVREKWKLDISKPLTINDVLFQTKATAQGIEGKVETRDNRFLWSFDYGVLTIFQDHRYWPRSFRYHDDESARLGKIKSKITAREAEAIARNALRGLGLNEKQLRLKEPPAVNQYKFEETDGTVYPLPMFNVAWGAEGWEDEMGSKIVRFDISGISTNVAEYFDLNPNWPKVPPPPNYLQMLNLPTNFFETLPERRRQLWNLPPLTNSPPQTTKMGK
jgi:hypothetical protein